MSEIKLVNINDERFWNILFDEACVEGQQAERIGKELEKIVTYDLDKVVEKLEEAYEDANCLWDFDDYYKGKTGAYCVAIEIVKGGGVNEL